MSRRTRKRRTWGGVVAVLATLGITTIVGVATTGGGAAASSPGEIHLPDLVAMEPFVVSEVQQCVGGFGSLYGNRCSFDNGTRFISFGTAPANLGDGPLQIRSEVNPEDQTTSIAYQRFYTYTADNQLEYVSEEPVGTSVYHPSHKHYHFDGYAEVQLRQASCTSADPACVGEPLETGVKLGFCLVSSGKTDETSLEHFASKTPYRDNSGSCRTLKTTQGISVGWYDLYTSDIPDQSVAIPQDLPFGNYWLTQSVDSEGRMHETNESNNESRVLIRYDPFPRPTAPEGRVGAVCKVSPITSASRLVSQGFSFAQSCPTSP